MNNEVEKFLSDKTKKKLQHGVDSLRVTPDQARASGALGQVGTTTGSLAGTIIGAAAGTAVKKPGQGAFLGAGIGAATGGGVGAAAGLYGARPRKRKKGVGGVITKLNDDGHKYLRNTGVEAAALFGTAAAVDGVRATRHSSNAKKWGARGDVMAHAAKHPALDSREGWMTAAGAKQHKLNAEIARGNVGRLTRSAKLSGKIAIVGGGLALASEASRKSRDGDGDGKLNEGRLKKSYDLREPNGRFARPSGMTEVPGSMSKSRDGDGDGQLDEKAHQKKIIANTVAGVGAVGAVADAAALKAGWAESKSTTVRNSITRVKPNRVLNPATARTVSRGLTRAKYVAGKGSFGLQTAGLAAGIGGMYFARQAGKANRPKEKTVSKSTDEIFAKARDYKRENDGKFARGAGTVGGAAVGGVAGVGAAAATTTAAGKVSRVARNASKEMANEAWEARNRGKTGGAAVRGAAWQLTADRAENVANRADLMRWGKPGRATGKGLIAAGVVGGAALGYKAMKKNPVQKSISEEHVVAQFNSADEVFAKAREISKLERETKRGLKIGAGIGGGLGAASGLAATGSPAGAVGGAVAGGAQGAVFGGLVGAAAAHGRKRDDRIIAAAREGFTPKKPKKAKGVK